MNFSSSDLEFIADRIADRCVGIELDYHRFGYQMVHIEADLRLSPHGGKLAVSDHQGRDYWSREDLVREAKSIVRAIVGLAFEELEKQGRGYRVQVTAGRASTSVTSHLSPTT